MKRMGAYAAIVLGAMLAAGSAAAAPAPGGNPVPPSQAIGQKVVYLLADGKALTPNKP
jgi:hypothetical protein